MLSFRHKQVNRLPFCRELPAALIGAKKLDDYAWKNSNDLQISYTGPLRDKLIVPNYFSITNNYRDNCIHKLKWTLLQKEYTVWSIKTQ